MTSYSFIHDERVPEQSEKQQDARNENRTRVTRTGRKSDRQETGGKGKRAVEKAGKRPTKGGNVSVLVFL